MEYKCIYPTLTHTHTHSPNKLSPNQPDKLSEALGYMSHDLAKSPLATPPKITRHVGTLSIKNKYSKNKDIIQLPQMKDIGKVPVYTAFPILHCGVFQTQCGVILLVGYAYLVILQPWVRW